MRRFELVSFFFFFCFLPLWTWVKWDVLFSFFTVIAQNNLLCLAMHLDLIFKLFSPETVCQALISTDCSTGRHKWWLMNPQTSGLRGQVTINWATCISKDLRMNKIVVSNTNFSLYTLPHDYNISGLNFQFSSLF